MTMAMGWECFYCRLSSTLRHPLTFPCSLRTRLRPENYHLFLYSKATCCNGDANPPWYQRHCLRCRTVSTKHIISNRSKLFYLIPLEWSEYWLGGERPAFRSSYLTCILNSAHVQLTAEASFLSFVCIMATFILIGVCSTLQDSCPV